MIPPYQNINVHFDLITITPFISRGRVDILLQTKKFFIIWCCKIINFYKLLTFYNTYKIIKFILTR